MLKGRKAMPKLSKIRLTGCKYDGLEKEHEDSIFDLTKDEEASHTLFTLRNSGGKGVMMQLIFQLLLPETRWGKNNGNKVTSMFYDRRNNLHPFTFHVALEWILDTVPEKRFITGIAVKAVIKNTSNEEEEKTGLQYFLYTHEYENRGYFTVENLPLYDKANREAVDINVLENFIDDNKRDFIKYSQSGVKRKDGDYYNYLQSRGILRSEWINLKAMNKSEGGIGDYFIGAGDNKSIFDKIIIPAISENIKNYTYDDGDNLIEMFRSNLSITKDLPILIQREGDYKDLLVEIKPLIENADSGSRFIDARDRLVGEGNDIFFILKDEGDLVTGEIEKWQNEKKRAEEERRNLHFKRDNFHYNQEKTDIENMEKEATQLNALFEEKRNEIKTNEEKLLLYRINEVLNSKKEVEIQIDNKILEKERLIEGLDISDVKAKAEQLDNEIEIEWEETTKVWVSIKNQFNGYLNYTDQIKEQNNNERKNLKSRIDDLQKEVNKFEIEEKELGKYKNRLEQYYDPLSLEFPERIVEDLEGMRQNTEGVLDKLSNEINNYKEKIVELNRAIDMLDYETKDKKKGLDLLEKEAKKQEIYELEIAKKISKQLLESYDGSLLNHNWFNKKFGQLEFLENDKKNNLQTIQKSIWEKSMDKLLNKEDYFIANKDIVIIKEAIGGLGIHVETGTEYLKGIDEEERLNILSNNPGFLYSIVLRSEKDWGIIEKNIGKDLFLNNMVPIYIRSEMKQSGNETFKIIYGRAHELVEEIKYMDWKSAMEGEIASLTQTEDNLKEDLKNIEKLKRELEFISKKDTAFIMSQKLKAGEKEIVELLEEARIKEEEKTAVNNKLIAAENDLKENQHKLKELNESIKQLEEYIEKIKETGDEKKRISTIKEEIEQFKNSILSLEEDNETIINNQNTVKDAHNIWDTGIESIKTDIKEVFKEAVFYYESDSSYINHKIPDFPVSAHKLKSLIKERKIVEEDIAAKEGEIKLIDKEVEFLYKEQNRYIGDLQKLDKHWANYKDLQLSINEINIMINKLERDIKKINNEKNSIGSKLDGIHGKLEVMGKRLKDKEQQILKDHRKSPIILEIDDISSSIDMVERDIKSNKLYLELCREQLKKNEDKGVKLQLNLTKIRNGYPLDLTRGKMDKILKGRIDANPDLVVDEWLRKCGNNRTQIDRTMGEGERFRSNFVKKIDFKLEEDGLKEKIITTVKEANISSFKNNLGSFKSMEAHFHKELLRLSEDKSKAEDVMKQWTNRASIYVIRMIEALKNMVAGMNYINEQGYVFPLVKLKGAERLPKDTSEITNLLNEYFIQSILHILEKNKDISNIDDGILKDLMGDRVMFSKALQGRYPILLVYKMSEKNEFMYARARDEYYTTWEAINKGEGDLPEGSGGQTLSVNTFVTMMIMSFKKKHIGNENPSTVLLMDNPFGKASAKHVLDPIFEIADKLNFQLICFAAPEIIKVEISERFPIFWELKIEEGKVVHGGRVIKH